MYKEEKNIREYSYHDDTGDAKPSDAVFGKL